jgi:hypothetical protein
MTSGYPDWLRAFLLLGKHDTTYLPVLLDANGNLYAVLKGDTGGGVLANVAVDASGQLIMVPRGQSGNYLVVDSSGFLTTVIKGDYEGALRTVKLDDQGRLSAFVIDSSDAWNQMLQVGNAELAARLGSIVRLDRRGTVMLVEDFEDGSSRWMFSQLGTDGAHSITPETAFSGGYALRLTTPSGATKWIAAKMNIPACAATSFGISAMLRTSTIYDHALITIYAYDGAYIHYLDADLHYPTSKIRVENAAGLMQAVADYTIDTGNAAGFHMLKVVGNISTDKWIRLLYDNHEYDISAVGILTSPDVSIPMLSVRIYLTSEAGGTTAIAEIDDVIVTAET